MVPPQEQYAFIPYLVVEKTYEFRVFGVNLAGRGEPSDTSPPVCIKPTRGYCAFELAYIGYRVRLLCS